jgi:SAM-dependent methyltransferase
MTNDIGLYDSHYSQLAADPQSEVRHETYGEDLGQASWLTLEELRGWLPFLRLDATQKALEVACGSGGVTCRIARETGASCVGVDINPHGIEAATRRAEREGLTGRVAFQIVDASQRLPFADASFDVVFCNDSVNHLADRAAVLRDWYRVLRPGGRLLVTDPIVVTGQLSNEEMRIRSSIGFFLFTPVGCNERLLREAGFTVDDVRDVTEAVAAVSGRWRSARARRGQQLAALEGAETFDGVQRFLEAVHTLSSEHRLSRFCYFASK